LSKSSPRPTNSLLHPSLQVALASLDVPLDAELERYRQHRKRMSPPPPPPSSQPVIIEGQLESRAADSSERSPWPVTSEAASGSQVQTDSAVDPSSQGLDISEGGSDGVIDDGSVLDSATGPSTYLESAERLRQGSEGERDSGVTSDEDPSVGSLSGLSTTSSQGGEGTQRKFTALGVGSVLLFLAATATLGYVLVNPESLGQLGLERFFGGGTASESGDSETRPDSGPESGSESASRGTGLPTSPDLAAEEFIQLDLSTLSSLDPETRSPLVTPPPTPQDAPPPSPETAATPPTPAEGTEPAENSLDNISALLTPESTGAARSEETSETSESENQEAEETNAELVTPDEASGPPPRIDRDRNYAGFVFVVVDYNDEVARLEQVREVVPDAYLREFPEGVKVQVGAFDDTGTAQGLVDRLTEEGISAQVYQPR